MTQISYVILLPSKCTNLAMLGSTSWSALVMLPREARRGEVGCLRQGLGPDFCLEREVEDGHVATHFQELRCN